MSNHTPAPWSVSKSAARDIAIIGESPFRGGVVVCNLADWGDFRNAETKCMQPIEADANLIAAAPDLLAACKIALDELISDGRTSKSSDGVEQLEIAIAKAEGRK